MIVLVASTIGHEAEVNIYNGHAQQTELYYLFSLWGQSLFLTHCLKFPLTYPTGCGGVTKSSGCSFVL